MMKVEHSPADESLLPAADIAIRDEQEQSKKISAYYSLVFPHYTFYIQTLSVTIGRRTVPSQATSSSSAAEQTPIDVDLGALKSVSRLHAEIEYDAGDDRFVLVVISRNGAWVDGVWSGAGTRAPLGERSQIQISSRIFHFVLPPPPPPEDTPSPSSQSSTNRPRSPSLDVTSISPPTSPPSHSPPPRETSPSLPPPKPQLAGSAAPGKLPKPGNPKKRKKNETTELPLPEPPIEKPKPEDMPPKPSLTYAQLIYRAIKALDGKATLQEICGWIMKEYDYYRFADGSAWMSSVRHNLSSGRAFKKMERCGGDRGKGFFWSLDEEHVHILEEQEAKAANPEAANATGGKEGKSRKKDKADGSTKRAKSESKNAPLPPPLTNAPLVKKVQPTSTTTSSSTTTPTPMPKAKTSTPTSMNATTGVFSYQAQMHPATSTPATTYPPSANPYVVLTHRPWAPQPHPAYSPPNGSTASPSPNLRAAAVSPPLPPVPALAPTPTTTTPAPAQPPQPKPAQEPTAAPAGSAQNATVPNVAVPIVVGPIPPTHPEYAPSHPNNSARPGYMILHEKKLILDPDVFSDLTPDMLLELEKMGARQALNVLTGHLVKTLKARRKKSKHKKEGKKEKAASATPALPNGGGPPMVVDPSPPPTQSDEAKKEEETIDIMGDSETEGPAPKKRRLDEPAVASLAPMMVA